LTATYVHDVTVFDGARTRERAGVLFEDGVIGWVGAHSRAPREAKAARDLSGGGRTLTPGLIDAHVHLCFDGEPDFVGEADVSEPFAAIKCAGNALRHLRAGTTTVRDLGGFGAVVCDVARAIDAGRIPGPRVVASGRALTITGGHGWNSFARQADGADGVREAVREQMRAGARSIKIVATGGVLTPGISVDFTAFTREEVEAAVDEAHTWGVPIAAHAIGATGIERCVRAGIDSIEHGCQISAELARQMKTKGTFHVPTISAIRGIVDHPEDVPAYAVTKGRQVMEQARESFGRVVRAGARHACGTDSGTPHNPHGSAPLEVIRMVEWGLPVERALQAATVHAAQLLRVGGETGSIEPGKAADMVLYAANPLDDVDSLLSPAAVFRAGNLVAGGL
jgi:imidazolonepropionase-like amidohydrolase